MKQVTSILLVLTLGLYLVPPHQPHTCFTHDGIRFHGECDTHEADHEGATNREQQFQTADYICYDIIKGSGNFLVRSNLAVNNSVPLLLDMGPITKPANTQSSTLFKLPEARCNTGPPLAAILLRGPPSCIFPVYIG